MYDFTHEPRATELAQRYEVHFTLPHLCAEQLATGDADIGLVPVAAIATQLGLKILPGMAIASLGEVRSILLITRSEVALKDLRTVALDSTSRTSAALVEILFNKFIGTAPVFTQHLPRIAAMLETADAALLIGDPALLAREAGICDEYRCYDLAAMWREFTGLPFVFAVWAMHAQALRDSHLESGDVVRDFQRSRDGGLANLDRLVDEWTPRIALPPVTIREYWSRNIYYDLDAACLEGLRLFYRYAAECGALPGSPALDITPR